MSSFRIDRQYVSFETAETQPVHATSQATGRRSSSGSQNTPGEDIEKMYEEIYKRLRKENAEQSEYILDQAKIKAQAISDQAKKQADAVMEKAEADAAAIREEAKKQGYLEGLKNAEAAAEKRKAEEAALLKKLEEELRSAYAGLVSSLDRDVIALVMDIVKKIIGIKLASSDDVFLGLVSDAIERLQQAGTVTIRVSSEDYIRYFGSGGPNFGTGDLKISVVEENSFSCGDLIVESEVEVLDLSVNRQIGQVENAFLSGEGN
jgi:flagellar assembly protein FliH